MSEIRYLRTLDYYDGPQVFEARDAIGGHYIAILGPGDEFRYLLAAWRRSACAYALRVASISEIS